MEQQQTDEAMRRMDFQSSLVNSFTSGLFLAVTLSWTKAVEYAFETLLPLQSVGSHFLTAVVMTVGVTFVVGVGSRIASRFS